MQANPISHSTMVGTYLKSLSEPLHISGTGIKGSAVHQSRTCYNGIDDSGTVNFNGLVHLANVW
jgi:hypothetical protein